MCVTHLVLHSDTGTVPVQLPVTNRQFDFAITHVTFLPGNLCASCYSLKSVVAAFYDARRTRIMPVRCQVQEMSLEARRPK